MAGNGDGSGSPCCYFNHSALREGIDSIENQISESLTQLTFNPNQIGQGGGEACFHLDCQAEALRDGAPARAGHVNDLLREIVQVHRKQGLSLVAATVELAKPGNDVRNVFAGSLNMLKVFPTVGGDAGFCA